MPSRRVLIVNQRGLHARAAARFAEVAGRYDARVRVSNGRETVGGSSIMGLLLLAAAVGTDITIRTYGADAAEALEALVTLVESGFGEAADGG